MTILLQVQLLPSSPSPDEKSLKQKKRPPEGSLFLERKTRLERRLACVCLSRTPLSRLRRLLPRGAVASPSPDEKPLKQKKRPPEGSLFSERKTRLERRLACVCLSRTPLSRLRRQLPRGAVASPSPDEKSLKQKKRPPEGSLFLERKTRLELATPTLARLCSTN